MSGIVIKRGFTGDNDCLCVRIEDHAPSVARDLLDPCDTFYIITDHERYFRCNDLWYPHTTGGIGRMIGDIKRELGLSAAQAIELNQAIADLMIAGG